MYLPAYTACIRNNPPRKVNTSTSITSPNYGRGHYPPNSHCKWNITTDPGFVSQSQLLIEYNHRWVTFPVR